MTRPEITAVWNSLSQSGVSLDSVVWTFADRIAEATRQEMRTGPFVVEKLENLPRAKA